jgi:hypothetical protein
MAIDEVTTWTVTTKDNTSPIPPGPDGKRPRRVGLAMQEFMASIARWRDTLSLANVSKVGTPVDNQVVIWTGDGTLEGDVNFTWDGSSLSVIGSFTSTGIDDNASSTALTIDSSQNATFAGDVTIAPPGLAQAQLTIDGLTAGINLLSDTADGFLVGATIFFGENGGASTRGSIGILGSDQDSITISTTGISGGLSHILLNTPGGIHQVQTNCDVVVGGYLLSNTATDAELNAIANVINTSPGKVQGAMVYNTTTDNPVYAVGSADGSVWVDGAGATVNTPVV